MTANARPLHSFNGVWDVYQVSFICFRLISSFLLFFIVVGVSALFLSHMRFQLRHHQAAQRSQLNQQITEGHTHAQLHHLCNLCANYVNGGKPLIRNEGFITKKAAVASFGKRTRQRMLGREAGRSVSDIFLSLFLLFFLSSFFLFSSIISFRILCLK